MAHSQINMSDASNQSQIELWNGRVGAKWAALQESLDAMLAGATAEMASRAGPIAALRVLDIGCGNGVTCTVWLKAGAQVTGVDVSEPMLAVARARTEGRANLVAADAAVWQGAVPFDLAVSQFGVMFFADPDLAFANIAANLRPGGRLLFICWRSMQENQWATLPMDAIRDLLPGSPAPDPHSPGPFALGDKSRLHGILERAGFSAIQISPFDFPVCLASSGGVGQATRFVLQIGPASAALGELDKAARAVAQQRFSAALAAHDCNGCVTLGGAAWIVEAQRET